MCKINLTKKYSKNNIMGDFIFLLNRFKQVFNHKKIK
jgi:hypothetical protein